METFKKKLEQTLQAIIKEKKLIKQEKTEDNTKIIYLCLENREKPFCSIMINKIVSIFFFPAGVNAFNKLANSLILPHIEVSQDKKLLNVIYRQFDNGAEDFKPMRMCCNKVIDFIYNKIIERLNFQIQ